ncbi:hypothetical protein [Picosynechococcus sp. PCC 7117]|uniref:hypothetical protein n=1 Tax=Picosynechococcus sp. PCC 7117 TaxID=195498 RepID=UPI00081044F2|nr:hypothetical protein [Picosynechococcus sp. PCC 7117]ANV88106.1 hypothetical protein AWQ22_11910 [Picosynechococcus sp. PCC 7117]
MVWQKLRKFAGHFVARPVALLLGLGLTAITPNLAQGATLEHRALSRSENFFASLNTRLIAQQQSAVFVYGTSPVAQQLGQDYMVLQVNDNNRVQGVFYQVNSEYACFSGAINNGKLDLAVLDPYEQVAYDYQLDYVAKGFVAAGGDRPTLQMVPAGFQPINVPSELDYALLKECADFQTPTKAVVDI